MLCDHGCWKISFYKKGTPMPFLHNHLWRVSPCSIWQLMNQTPPWFMVEMFEMDYLLYQENPPKGVKSSSRSVDVTRGNLAWKFERQLVRTDVVFISVCLSRRTARLLDLSTAASASAAMERRTCSFQSWARSYVVQKRFTRALQRSSWKP